MRDAREIAREIVAEWYGVECGDVIDRFPCPRCGAATPKKCPLPMAQRVSFAEILNNPALKTTDRK